MYSMQRPKLAQQPIVDQVEFFNRFPIIMNKIKSFKDFSIEILYTIFMPIQNSSIVSMLIEDTH